MAAKFYIDELIKIANLIPSNEEIPSYDLEIERRFSEESGKTIKDFDKSLDKKLLKKIFYKIWDEAKAKYPDLAEYVENAHKGPIGKYPDAFGSAFLKEPPPSRMAFDLTLNDRFFMASTVNNDLQYISGKIQNLIRVMRVCENMRIVALTVREKLNEKKESKSAFPFNRTNWKFRNRIWKEEYYNSFFVDASYPGSFKIQTKKQSNKIIGQAIFHNSVVQSLISQIDVFKIKACNYCNKIFLAEPRNMKFCSPNCNDRKKSKKNYHARKNKPVIFNLILNQTMEEIFYFVPQEVLDELKEK